MAVSKDGLQYRFVIPGTSGSPEARSDHFRDQPGAARPTDGVARHRAVPPNFVPGPSRDNLTPCSHLDSQHLLEVRREPLSEHHKAELDRHFAWFEGKLSPGPAKFVAWLRKPSSMLVRIPLAILLIVGGIFGFLPILGLWMLPLGLLLFAQDVPMLQGPMARMLGWIERKWEARQRAKAAQ